LNGIEDVLGAFPNTINAAVALATFTASAVALWSAHHAWSVSQPQIEVYVRASQLAAQDGKLFLVNLKQAKKNCISVLVRNISAYAVAFDKDSLTILYPEGGGVLMYADEPFYSEGKVSVPPFSEEVRMWFKLSDFTEQFGTGALRRPWPIRRFWRFGFSVPGRVRAKMRVDRGLKRMLNAEIRKAEKTASAERRAKVATAAGLED